MEAWGQIKDVDNSISSETHGNSLNNCLTYLLIQSTFNKEHQSADSFSSQTPTDVKSGTALLLYSRGPHNYKPMTKTSCCSFGNFHWGHWWVVLPNYLQTTSSAVTGGVPGHIWSSFQLTPHSTGRWGVGGVGGVEWV